MFRGSRFERRLKQRRSRRASALTYVLVVVAGTSVAVVTLIAFAGQAYRKQVSAEYKIAAQYAFEGAVAQIRSEEDRDLIVVPVTKSITVGGITTSVTVTDNELVEDHTHRIDATATSRGQSYASTTIIGIESDSFFNYAYALRGAGTLARAIDAFNGGGIYAGGNLTVNATGSSAAGDLKVAGTLGGSSSISVAGDTFTNAKRIDVPTVSAGDYLAAADATYYYDPQFNGGTPPTPYFLVYVEGKCSLNNGTYGGKSILFVNGDVQVNGTMSYADANSEIVVICTGNLVHGSAGSTPVGTYYVGGSMIVNKPFNFTRGIVVANGLSLTSTTTCNFDPLFKNNPDELVNFKIPGYWP